MMIRMDCVYVAVHITSQLIFPHAAHTVYSFLYIFICTKHDTVHTSEWILNMPSLVYFLYILILAESHIIVSFIYYNIVHSTLLHLYKYIYILLFSYHTNVFYCSNVFVYFNTYHSIIAATQISCVVHTLFLCNIWGYLRLIFSIFASKNWKYNRWNLLRARITLFDT